MWLLFPFQKNKFSLAYGCPLTIPKTNFKNNYVIFKPNHFFFFLNNNFFPINLFNNYLPPFLIIICIL
jgi:hypothetical protein